MTVRELLGDERSRAVLEKHLPELLGHPLLWAVRDSRVRDLLYLAKGNVSDEAVAAAIRDLENL